MKKFKLIFAVGMLSLAMAGCGQEDTLSTVEPTQMTEESSAAEESAAESTEEATESSAEASESEEASVEETPSSEEAASSEATEGTSDEKTFTDNFSVDSESAAAFGKQVKDAVAAKDLEGLADLMFFPTYLGFPEEYEKVETREDFIAFGADVIFTDGLLESVAAADENSLSASRAGFCLNKGVGEANVVFGVAEGKLAVMGINY